MPVRAHFSPGFAYVISRGLKGYLVFFFAGFRLLGGFGFPGGFGFFSFGIIVCGGGIVSLLSCCQTAACVVL